MCGTNKDIIKKKDNDRANVYEKKLTFTTMHFTLFEIIIGNGFDFTLFGIAYRHYRTRALIHIGYWPMGWDFYKRPTFQSLSIFFFRIDKKP